MIKDRNIDPGALISISKIQGMGMEGPLVGEVHYVAKDGIQARTWLGTRVPGDQLHKTLDAALASVTASRGDTIVVCPYHTETITGAGGITLDKAGVEIIGVGRYDARPTFLMDAAATVSMLVTAADMRLANCKFLAGHADINYFADVAAKGFKLESCFIGQNAADENFIDAINVGTANNDSDGLELVGNEIVMGDAADVGGITIAKNQNDVKIIGNRIIGDFDASPYAPIYAPSTEIMLNILVAHNLVHNQHNDNAAVGISIANTASTGWIIYNHIGHQDILNETPILAGAAGLYVGENYASGVLGTASGYLYPAADG